MKNREIKFRVFSKQQNPSKMIYLPTDGSYSGRDLISDKDWIVMQFTGLYDKNGKEIYEGDVVRFKLFDEATPCYWEVKIPNIYLAMKNEENHQIEVIGNRYQNPELLVDKKR